jgi:hypothetical protein
MHGQNRRGARRYRGVRGGRIDQAGFPADVDAYRRSAHVTHRHCGRDEGVGGEDDLVAGSDPRRLEHDDQRCRTRTNANAVPRPAVVRELPLESVDLLAKDERACPHDSAKRLAELPHQRLMLPR